MMRLLFLCLLLLLAATALSEDNEGSADGEVDDEDLIEERVFTDGQSKSGAGPSTGEEEISDHFTLIVVIVAVSALTLSVAAIVTIMLVRRHMRNQLQGVYSVPVEQHHKGV